MFEKAKSGRDAFIFSLQGLRTMAPFTVATAIANDRINRAWDERLSRLEAEQPDKARDTWALGRFWLLKRLRN